MSSAGSSGQSSAAKAEEEMRYLKLDAIEKGLVTDFSFIVGPDKETAELMHCFKSDLLMATDFFQAVVECPLAGPCPVHIKHIKPHIFKMVLRFISLNKVFKVPNLVDYVLLGLAADEFLLEPLRTFCATEIEKMVKVNNVWQTLNSSVRIPKLAESCNKVLSYETSKCLQHPSFLEASKESLLYLLEIDSLNIKSELELLDASLKLANSWAEEEGFELMRAALPHLRLLTLQNEQLSQLAKFLTAEEKTFLSAKMLFGDENLSAPSTLNSSTTPRACAIVFESVLVDIIPSNLIVTDHMKMIGQPVSKSQVKLNQSEMFSVDFVDIAQNVCLTGIEILTQANNHPQLVRGVGANSNRFEAVDKEYTENILVQVLSFVDPGLKQPLYLKEVRVNQKFNSWFSVNFEQDVCLTKGTNCTVQVTVCPRGAKADYQTVPLAQIFDTFRLSQGENPLAKHVDVKNYFLNFDAQGRFTKVPNVSPVCILKSVSFAPI